jgi:homoserine kinase
MEAGALGCSISGSGPSLFALSTSENVARKIAAAMLDVCAGCGMESESYVSGVNGQGAVIV